MVPKRWQWVSALGKVRKKASHSGVSCLRKGLSGTHPGFVLLMLFLS